MEWMIQMVAAISAAALVMVLHELPKAIVYHITSRRKIPIGSVFHISQYVDFVGVLCCVATGAGFSKPYRYKIETKRQAFVIGITGLGSCLVAFLSFMLLYQHCYEGVRIQEMLFTEGVRMQFTYWFLALSVVYSLSMFFMNLLPLTMFDMGLLVASASVTSYIMMIRHDMMMKLLLYAVLLLQLFPILTIHIVNRI